ncbi:MAG: twin-arginine translocation signal domain-containing protein [Candidatus Zixiibacteriota bacterium]
MDKYNNEPLNSEKEQSNLRTGKKINRRQFLKVGAAASASGAVFGASALSGNKEALLANVAKTSVAQKLDNFPVKITAKCKRFDQKNTIFN